METYVDVFSKYFEEKGKLHEDYPSLAKMEENFNREAALTFSEWNKFNKDIINYIHVIAEVNNSNRVENIIETYLETGTNYFDNRDKITRPICNGLLGKVKMINKELLDKYSIFHNHKKTDRNDPSFGVYNLKAEEKIYEPIIDSEELQKEYNKFFTTCNKAEPELFQNKLSLMLLQHIWFEKIHPYSDGNGRLGRFLLEHNLQRYLRYYFKDDKYMVLPISWAVNKHRDEYYGVFENVDKGIKLDVLFKIITTTLKGVREFLNNYEKVINSNLEMIKKCTTKDNQDMLYEIAASLVIKRQDFISKYNVDPKTVNTIFEKLNKEGMYNFDRVNGNVTYINNEIDELLNVMYR